MFKHVQLNLVSFYKESKSGIRGKKICGLLFSPLSLSIKCQTKTTENSRYIYFKEKKNSGGNQVAQLVERGTLEVEVRGSKPVLGT